MNTSLRLCVARWCGDVPAEFAARVPGGIADGLGLAASTVAWLARGAGALVLAAVLVAAWRGRASAVGRLWAVAAAALLAVWFVPCALPGGDLVGDAMDERLNSLYVVTFGDLALLAYAVRRAWSAAREDRDAA
jgi:hypothetical protein